MTTAAMFNSMAVAFGTMSAAMYPDTVTFMRPTNSVDTVGGITTSTAATSPTSVPCRWRPLTAKELEVAVKRESEADYAIFVPAQYSSALIDVDGRCDAVIAARSGSPAEPARTFKTYGISRFEGLEIEVLASLEE